MQLLGILKTHNQGLVDVEVKCYNKIMKSGIYCIKNLKIYDRPRNVPK